MSNVQGGNDNWFCATCGAAGVPGNRFCSACGSARSAHGSTSTPPNSVSASTGQTPTTSTPAPSSSPSSNRSTLFVVAGIAVVIILLIAGLVIGKTLSDSGKSDSAVGPSTSISPTTVVPITTVAPTTSTIPPTPTELGDALPFDPNKCGIDASSKPYAHSPTRTYEVTATIGLWSAPNTGSQLLKTIPVTTYGTGGIGCPDGLDPKVTITCQITNGQTIDGPFGNDPVWLRTTYDGVVGYVTDQWVDTEWDTNVIPRC